VKIRFGGWNFSEKEALVRLISVDVFENSDQIIHFATESDVYINLSVGTAPRPTSAVIPCLRRAPRCGVFFETGIKDPSKAAEAPTSIDFLLFRQPHQSPSPLACFQDADHSLDFLLGRDHGSGFTHLRGRVKMLEGLSRERTFRLFCAGGGFHHTMSVAE
jgi:hypothetical protein